MRFELGHVVMTEGISYKLNKSDKFSAFVFKSMYRYMEKDWGEMCQEDKESNDFAFENGERIFAAYENKQLNEKIWIITEWDRSVTTILLPEEY